jgi:hypothetical protein
MVNSIAAALVAASVAAAVPAVSTSGPAPGIKAATIRIVKEVAPAAAAPVPPRSVFMPKAKQSAGEIAAGAVIGGVAGFFAGGFGGAKFDRAFHDCRCDDPGLKGFLIGAPVGTILGAVLGGKFLFR